jgi:hypothetical protein
MSRGHLIGLIPLFAFVHVAWAGDTVTLRGGDLVSGRLVEIAEDIVVFRAPMAGKLILPIDELDAVTTESERVIRLKDGTTITGRLAGAGAATYVIAIDGFIEGPVSLAAIDRVSTPEKPPPDVTKPAPEPAGPRWRGSLEGGMLWRAGTRDFSDPFTGLTIHRAGDRHDFRSTLLLNLAHDDTFPVLYRALAEWKLQTSPSWYTVFAMEAERDIKETVDLRSDLTIGAGTALIDNAVQRLEGDAGIGLTLEYFDPDAVGRRFWQGLEPLRLFSEDPAAESRENNQEINLRFRMRYERDVFRRSRVQEEILIYPSLTDPGDIRARAESSFTWPFTTRLNLKLNFLLDYEGDKEYSQLEAWRTTVGASLMWEF